MTPLPIDEHIPRILGQLRQSRALVVVAEPGAGKTTRIPPAIVKSDLLGPEHPNLVMLQPRRVAARAAAMRIAAENDWHIGQEVGWHVRFDRRLTSRTRLRVLTEGILTRQLIEDPFLQGVGAVVLDEFHERSIHTDLTIALLREVRQTVRPDLMIVVMSATLDAAPVAGFLGDCPIIEVPGRTYPIQIEHVAVASGQPLPQRVAEATEHVRWREEGNILVFLPGVQEINRTAREIASVADRGRFRVFPLHGSLPPEQQNRALEPCPQRKIILATNIAETSLTIEGVRVVIDSGLARVAGYDPQRGLDRLDLKRISKASARQRAGRAGRTAPGLCIRLYSEKEFHAMPDFELPEIRRVDLAGTVLALHAWGKPDPRSFAWFEAPPEATIASAERLLEMLGAIERGKITKLGQQMVSLPVHPRLARLLIAAVEQDMLTEGAAVAALLSEKDIAPDDRVLETQAASDLFVRLELIESNPQVARLRDELIRIGGTITRPAIPRHHDREEAMLRLALVGYPDRVCRRRATDPSAGVMVGGGGVRLAAESVVRQHEFFVALEARQDDRSPTREALVRIASGIQPQWLEEYFPHEIRRERKLVFDAQRRRVVCLSTVSYRDLAIRQERDAPVDPQEAGNILAEVLKPDAAALLWRNDEAATFLARVDLLRRAMPEHDWPTFDPAQIVSEMCQGRRSVEEVERISPLPFLQSRLPYPLKRLLDEHAPETIQVPSGSRIRVQYAAGQPPVLAVRLQELFGWTDTPRIAAGRVPVVLHLLGPNLRPVQITSDLSSFWKTTYFDVRKDLRVRYPKHSWPEDPLSAKPQAKGGRRR
ncbi:ATP-dependent helicase HrpB [Fontivita pretiosa]|uniref:ATP-dependent helicase HrpB n=1 Tax=Fontivita pretiosa TaxID=2989684 RepID=UPI003D184281